MTKKRMKISETALLQRRWCMFHANVAVGEENLERTDAMNKAYMAWDILDGMGRGIVKFSYYESDGSYREARGTLKQGISAAFDAWLGSRHKPRKKNEDGDLNFVYWDLDAEGWRSFKIHRLDKIEEIIIRETGELPVAPVNDNQID